MSDVDVVIVGGGPAGLATALFLADARPELIPRILVLEKKTYPREKYCAGAIAARADELLATVGVRVDVPSVRIAGLSLRAQQGRVCERHQHIGRVVRRIEFDHELARAVRKKGIRIEENAPVTALAVDVGGVTVTTRAGAVRACAVVGADGVGSFVRRTMGKASAPPKARVIELDTEPVATDLPRDILHFDTEDRRFTGYTWDFPTLVSGQPMVCRGIYHIELSDRPVDLHSLLAERLAARGLDINRYKLKRYAERGFEPRVSQSAPRVLLVGEAAGIDGLTGEGIAQAVEYAAIAGPYLAEKLTTRDFAFGDWSRRIARSKLGIDLHLRHRLLSYYSGPHRSWFERHVLLTPPFVECSMERFAGRRIKARRLIAPLVSAAWHFVAPATNAKARIQHKCGHPSNATPAH